jgi:hypothetical protein
MAYSILALDISDYFLHSINYRDNFQKTDPRPEALGDEAPAGVWVDDCLLLREENLASAAADAAK